VRKMPLSSCCQQRLKLHTFSDRNCTLLRDGPSRRRGLLAGVSPGPLRWLCELPLERGGDISMVPHSVAVAPDIDDVTVVHEPVDQGTGHDFVAEDLAPFLEALVRSEHRGCVLIAAAHELEEEHRPGPADRQVAQALNRQFVRARQVEFAASKSLGFRLLRLLIDWN
jgi:hypothetical protein